MPRAESQGLSQSFSRHASEPHSRLNFPAIPAGLWEGCDVELSIRAKEDGNGAGLSPPTHVTHHHRPSPELTLPPARARVGFPLVPNGDSGPWQAFLMPLISKGVSISEFHDWACHCGLCVGGHTGVG